MRVREALVGTGVATVAVMGIVLLVLVRSEAARSAGDRSLEATEEAALPEKPPVKSDPAATVPRNPLPIPRPPAPHATGLPPSPRIAPPALPPISPPPVGDAALEQRKLASLERRARAISRRMESAEKRGDVDPSRAERDRQQLDTLIKEIRQKREELGLPSDWSPDEEAGR